MCRTQIRADVEQLREGASIRNRRHDGRAFDFRQTLEHEVRNRRQCACVTGADHAVGESVVNEIGSDTHGRLFLAPDRLARRIGHRDDLARLDEFKAITNTGRRCCCIEQGRNDTRLPDELQTQR